MGKKELKNRDNWQTSTLTKALNLEQVFYSAFGDEFKKPANKNFRIRSRPREFKNVYKDVVLSKKTEKQIYRPEINYTHGISIDFAIDNIQTQKTLYIEIKRQEGWVENLPASAGRGNAHERLCKFFTPGLLDILRQRGQIHHEHLPFWIVFGGNITRDPKRVREITCWFGEYQNHFFMWRNPDDRKILITFFNRNLKSLLL